MAYPDSYAAAHTVVGQACYTGISGTIITGNLLKTENIMTGANLTRQTPKATLTDGAGNTVAMGYARPTDSLAIKFTPVATPGTNTALKAAANVVLPAIGTKVTLGDTGILAYDGDWNYDGDATIETNATGPLVISMTLSRKGALSGVNPTALAALG
jgi:hypothetical protein